VHCITVTVYTMTGMITLRVDEETKRKIKRYGIPVSNVARTAIMNEIRRREHEDTLQALKKMKRILHKVDVKRIVKHIREDRDSR